MFQSHFRSIKSVLFCLSLLTLSAPTLASTLTVNTDSCFKDYAVANNRFMDYLPRCLDELRTTPSGSNTINSHINELNDLAKSSPNSPILQIISQKAATVYYDNQFCGDNLKLTLISCNNLGSLSRTHASGFYRFDCNTFAARHAKCAEFSQILIDLKKDFCNLNTLNKNFCNKLIQGFLNSPPCAATSTTAVCSAHINAKINTDPCSMNNFDLSLCTGGTVSDVDSASVTEPASGDTTGGGDTPIDPTSPPSGGDPTGDQIADTAQRLGQRFFGGNNMANAPMGQLNIPNSDTKLGLSANADGSPVLGEPEVMAADGIPQYPVAGLLPTQTMGEPGGEPKQPGGGGGQNQGGGAPVVGGNPAGGGGAAAAGNNAGRGGYGTSRLKEILDKMNGGFMGTTALSSNPGGTAVLNENIKKQIEENKLKDPDYRNKINSAYKSGLQGAGTDPNFFDAVYFPSVRKAYEELEQSNQILPENGL